MKTGKSKTTQAVTIDRRRWLAAALLAGLALTGCAATADLDSVPDPDPVGEASAALLGSGASCDDGNPCTLDANLSGICRHIVLVDGASCSDGNLCNGAETCHTGRCQAGTPLACDDGNVCTASSCQPSVGCVYTPIVASCDDGNACTVVDQCSAGVCVGQGATSGTPTVPTMTLVGVTAPAPGGVVARPDVFYVAGPVVDFVFRLPTCTWITGVVLGGHTLATAPQTACDDVNPGPCDPNYYTVEGDTSIVAGTHDLKVRLHLAPTVPPGSGFTMAAVFTAKSSVGTMTKTYQVAAVADVLSGTNMVTSISQNELQNDLIASVYGEFGDQGSASLGNTSIYDPDYGQTSLTIDGGGVHIHLHFTASVPNWCDPSVDVKGTFQLRRSGTYVVVVWNAGDPVVSLDFATECDVAGGVIQALITALYASWAEDDIATMIDTEVAGFIPAEAVPAINHFETAPGELRVYIAPPFDTIAVDIPYDATRLRNAAATGMLLSAGDAVEVLSSNLVHLCRDASTPEPGCASLAAAGAGLFNWLAAAGDASAPPVPDPYVLYGTQYAYEWERVHARARLLGVSRTPSLLPRPHDNVGALLAQDSLGSAPWLIGAGPCVLPPSNRTRWLGLGPNDVPSANLGSGSRRVYLMFVSTDASTNFCF